MDQILRVGALRRFASVVTRSNCRLLLTSFISFQPIFKSACHLLRLVSHMAPVTGNDIFGGDSDLSDVPSEDEWDISTPPTHNTPKKQKSSSSKLTARPAARNRSPNRGKLALAAIGERPARSTRPRGTYATSTSSSSGEVSPASSPPLSPFVASRKRKIQLSELPIDTTPAKRQKKQDRSLLDSLVGAMDKENTPSKYPATAFPIEWIPSQSPSRQEGWDFRRLQDTKVFVKLLRTNGSPAASDAPLAETYWWPARVSIYS